MLKAKDFNIALDKDSPQTLKMLESIQDLEHQGYEFESADGSLELIVRKIRGEHHRFFDLEGFKVLVEKRRNRLINESIGASIRLMGVDNSVDIGAVLVNRDVHSHLYRRCMFTGNYFLVESIDADIFCGEGEIIHA